jgi:putative flippase GtrA
MKFSRFVLTGGLCAVLNNTLVVVLVHAGFGSSVASVMAFGPVLLIGYALHSVFTFGTPPSRLSFSRYAFAMAANFPIWIAALYVFCEVLKASIAIAAPATTVLIFLWNYMSAKWAFVPDTGSAPMALRQEPERRIR